ncbi:MAG: squalene--hopene cyclase, partial [Lentisphaerae bacterium]|nr:squalene--hopene cyclase [Lentisphaerota bacterium]
MTPPLEQSLLTLLRNHPSGGGPWEGRLTASALSTAVAAFALHCQAPAEHAGLAGQALAWLADHANPDGGWGDTINSESNLSTTLLCRAALSCSDAFRLTAARQNAEAWIIRRTGSRAPAAVAAAIRECYGHDRTFSAPILTMCALAGCLGPEPDAWRLVPQLPFELAALPAQLYRSAKLPMVSYALPALIAMGLARHHHHPGRAGMRSWLRHRLTPRLLDKIMERQPASGGFLEAAPLTAFVAMALGAAGAGEHPVTRRAIGFLAATIRPDGSWPIDTNLKTWVTTQAVAA